MAAMNNFVILTFSFEILSWKMSSVSFPVTAHFVVISFFVSFIEEEEIEEKEEE